MLLNNVKVGQIVKHQDRKSALYLVFAKDKKLVSLARVKKEPGYCIALSKMSYQSRPEEIEFVAFARHYANITIQEVERAQSLY